MKQYINRIAEDIVNDHLDYYWAGFKSVAYAVYDRKYVYLFNHPKMIKTHQNKYQILKWNEEFTGCTLILHDDFPTAIVDIELYKDYESLYSILIHELFHGFQYINNETRFPNEIHGVTYPLLKENIELRNQERENLYYAVLESNQHKKKQYINNFIAYREKRDTVLTKHLCYEKLIETVEGPAWYVELAAYSENSNIPYSSVLKKYGKHLIDKFESTFDLRKSCYSSGMYMCLLLDELSPRWKEDFWKKDVTLYDILKQKFSEEIAKINNFEINPETEKIMTRVIQNRKNTFETFEQQEGIHLYIHGEITAKSFDPMNIVSMEDKLLHMNFIKVGINNSDYYVHQPVIAYCNDGLHNIRKLHLILKNSPIQGVDSLIIEGIGEINGSIVKQGKAFHLFVTGYV